MADSAGLLFKIKGDETDAVRALKNTEQAADSLTTSTKAMGASFAQLAGAEVVGNLIGSALRNAAQAAVDLIPALFNLTKNTAEFGSQIFDASEKTGLSAETLSAMKYAADQSGSSLEAVTGAAAKFSKTIADAGNGSKEAQAKLDRLGVTSKDLDTALGQALATIIKVKPGTDQMAAAMDAFGKSGADLLPFIKSFDGDLAGLTAKAKELGLTISNDAAKAADEFGDQLDTLNDQLAAVGHTIGFALMPVFNKMATDISGWLSKNQGEVKAWAASFAQGIQDVSDTAQGMNKDLSQPGGFWDTLHAIDKWITSHSAIYAYGESLRQGAQVDRANASNTLRSNNTVDFSHLPGQMYTPPSTRRFGWGGGMGDTADQSSAPSYGGTGDAEAAAKAAAEAAKKAEEAAEKRRREREATEKADLSARIQLEQGYIKEAESAYTEALEGLRKKFQETGNAALFVKETTDALTNRTSAIQEISDSLNKLEFQQLGVYTGPQADALEQKQKQRVEALNKAGMDAVDKNNELIKNGIKKREDLEDKAFEKRLKQGAEEADAAQAHFEAEMDRQEQLEKLHASEFSPVTQIGETLKGLTNPNADEEADPFYRWKQSWEDFFSTVEQDAPVLGSLFEDLGGIMQGAFQGLAQAIGSVVQQWVLYGNTGPAVMRKMLAAVLASVAAEAAVKAIMATAEGFYFLATGNFASAANAFTAAAFYGAVAGVAALAGRAIAGDSFKQQSGRATGGSSASSGQGSHGNQGQAYSSFGDDVTVKESGRNAPAGIKVTVSDDSQWLGKMLKFQIETNAGVRDMIKGVAEG